MILAIETATEVCSVAIKPPYGKIEEKRITGKAVHSEKLFGFIDFFLNKYRMKMEQFSMILVSRGPGQYTGLRIGAAGIKGLMLGNNIQLWSIGTLEGFAASFIGRDIEKGNVHAVIDARRKHLYYQSFRFTGNTVTAGEATILEIDEIESMINPGDTIIGTGLERLPSYGNVEMKFLGHSYISAANLIKARFESRYSKFFIKEEPEQFEPVYLTTRQVNDTPAR